MPVTSKVTKFGSKWLWSEMMARSAYQWKIATKKVAMISTPTRQNSSHKAKLGRTHLIAKLTRTHVSFRASSHRIGRKVMAQSLASTLTQLSQLTKKRRRLTLMLFGWNRDSRVAESSAWLMSQMWTLILMKLTWKKNKLRLNSMIKKRLSYKEKQLKAMCLLPLF